MAKKVKNKSSKINDISFNMKIDLKNVSKMKEGTVYLYNYDLYVNNRLIKKDDQGYGINIRNLKHNIIHILIIESIKNTLK
ncbi:MAG: hypothetical protein ACFFG0_48510 [Candidatus Thorarchaeota archaeon]